MPLTEKTIIGKIEVVGEHKHVQVRTDTIIERDGQEVSRSYHRHVVSPGQDVSNEAPEVQAICQAVHTEEVVEKYRSSIVEGN